MERRGLIWVTNYQNLFKLKKWKEGEWEKKEKEKSLLR
jgi:hypothetical protein